MNQTELKKIDAYWRASNYLAAGQLYLLDNPLLRRPLTRDDVKKKIVGHWGTVPGQNFVYVHLLSQAARSHASKLSFGTRMLPPTRRTRNSVVLLHRL